VEYDTQLSRPEYAIPQLEGLKRKGYETHLIAVTIDPQVALQRVMERARKTGRNVSVKETLEAHKRFNGALEEYLQLADRAGVWDNTSKPTKIAVKTRIGLDILNSNLYNTIYARGR
jgi:predicted ABC-type ATPase